MFLFKSRKKYNGSVDKKLTESYGIDTRDNPKFPGVLAYLKIIDQTWSARFTEEEAAMYIASLYYSGLKKEGFHTEANALGQKIARIGQSDFSAGKISAHRLATFMAHIENANNSQKTAESEINGAGAEYAMFSEMLRMGQADGHTCLNREFWAWVENTLGKEVREIGFSVSELIRNRVLFIEPEEMHTISLSELDGISTELLKYERSQA